MDPVTPERDRRVLTHISASSAKAFNLCQRKWYFRYIDGVPDPPRAAQKLGTDTHAVLEAYLKGEPIPDWNATKAHQVARSGIAHLPPPGTGTAEVSIKVPLPLSGVDLIGYVDYYNADDPECLHVLDHKTSRTFDFAHTPKSLADDIQMLAYAGALIATEPKAANAPIAKLEHVYYRTSGLAASLPVTTTVPREKALATLDNLDRLAVRQKGVAYAGGAGYVAPSPGAACSAFGGCRYADLCDASPTGRARARLATALVPTSTPTPEVPLPTLAELRARAANPAAATAPPRVATPIPAPTTGPAPVVASAPPAVIPADSAPPVSPGDPILAGAARLRSACGIGRFSPRNIMVVLGAIDIRDAATIKACAERSGLVWDGECLSTTDSAIGTPQPFPDDLPAMVGASKFARSQATEDTTAVGTVNPAPADMREPGEKSAGETNKAIAVAVADAARAAGGVIGDEHARRVAKDEATRQGIKKFHSTRYDAAIGYGELNRLFARSMDGSIRALGTAGASAPVVAPAPIAIAGAVVGATLPAPVATPVPTAPNVPDFGIHVGIYVDCADTSAAIPSLRTVLEPMIAAVCHENGKAHISEFEYNQGPKLVASKLVAAIHAHGIGVFTESRYLFSKSDPLFPEVYGALVRSPFVYFVVPSLGL